MDDQRKNAYRYLIYWAFQEVRALRWTSNRGKRGLNPLHWHREGRRLRGVGALSDWLGDLAMASCDDFAAFDESRFWKLYDKLREKYPHAAGTNYRELFDQRLADVSKADSI